MMILHIWCCYQVRCANNDTLGYGPLIRYIKLRVAHAPGMTGTFSPPPRVSDPDMHNGECVTHVPWCMPGSLTSGFLWSRWRGKHSRHSPRMGNTQFYISGKRPMGVVPFGIVRVILRQRIGQYVNHRFMLMGMPLSVSCSKCRENEKQDKHYRIQIKLPINGVKNYE